MPKKRIIYKDKAIICKFFQSSGACFCEDKLASISSQDINCECSMFYLERNCKYWRKRID